MKAFPRRSSTFLAQLLACTLAGGLLLGGCATTPKPAVATEAPIPPPPPPPPQFVIVAGMLDTWNAMGELLVNLQGVDYHGRSQMLGLYDVDYHGERILLITKAFVLDSQTRAPTTMVRATAGDGKPDTSPAAIELLQLLETRLPDELQRIASLPAPAKPVAKKKKPKRR